MSRVTAALGVLLLCACSTGKYTAMPDGSKPMLYPAATIRSWPVVDGAHQAPSGRARISIDESAELESGVQLGDGVRVGAKVSIDEDTILMSNVSVGDETRIGDDAIVQSNTRIGNRVTIGGDTKIGTASVIEDGALVGAWAKVGNRVTVGSNAKVGAASMLEDGVTIAKGKMIPQGSRIAASK